MNDKIAVTNDKTFVMNGKTLVSNNKTPVTNDKISVTNDKTTVTNDKTNKHFDNFPHILITINPNTSKIINQQLETLNFKPQTSNIKQKLISFVKQFKHL